MPGSAEGGGMAGSAAGGIAEPSAGGGEGDVICAFAAVMTNSAAAAVESLRYFIGIAFR